LVESLELAACGGVTLVELSAGAGGRVLVALRVVALASSSEVVVALLSLGVLESAGGLPLTLGATVLVALTVVSLTLIVDDESIVEVAVPLLLSSMPTVPLALPASEPVAGSGGNANDHERTRSALWNDFPVSVLISVSPLKFPQNICAVLVPITAELNVVKADAGEPGGRSGLPSAFCTFSQLPRHDDG